MDYYIESTRQYNDRTKFNNAYGRNIC